MTDSVIFQKSPMPIEVEEGKTYLWCARGKSAKQPLCDGSHSKLSKNCRLSDLIGSGFGLDFSFITIHGNRPVKKVNGNRTKSPCSYIFAHGFDIVIQAPPFMDQNNHWRTLFISFGKIGADRAVV